MLQETQDPKVCLGGEGWGRERESVCVRVKERGTD